MFLVSQSTGRAASKDGSYRATAPALLDRPRQSSSLLLALKESFDLLLTLRPRTGCDR